MYLTQCSIFASVAQAQVDQYEPPSVRSQDKEQEPEQRKSPDCLPRAEERRGKAAQKKKQAICKTRVAIRDAKRARAAGTRKRSAVDAGHDGADGNSGPSKIRLFERQKAARKKGMRLIPKELTTD